MSEAAAFQNIGSQVAGEAARRVPAARARPVARQVREAAADTEAREELARLAAAIASLTDRQGTLVLHFCSPDEAEASPVFARLARQIARGHHTPVLCLSAGLMPVAELGRTVQGHAPSDITLGGMHIRHDGDVYHAVLATDPNDAPRLQQARELYGVLKEKFPLILVNAAPALSAPAITNLAVLADAVVLTVQSEVTHLSAIRRTKAMLADLGAPMLGVIYSQKRRLLPAWIERLLSAS